MESTETVIDISEVHFLFAERARERSDRMSLKRPDANRLRQMRRAAEITARAIGLRPREGVLV